ncbi:hypothetical protein HQ576_10395, partial [bacterium]|nr:hypothetical protein [bacterium]
GPLLDACGWAVNARVKINIPFGRALTGTAKLPANARRTFEDPYGNKHKGSWVLVLFFVAVVAGALAYWWFILRPKHAAKPDAPAKPVAAKPAELKEAAPAPPPKAPPKK